MQTNAEPAGGTRFRQVAVRGLGFILPPLLTILLLLWAWQTIDRFVLSPFDAGLRQAIAWVIDRSLSPNQADEMVRNGLARKLAATDELPARLAATDGREWIAAGKNWIPRQVYEYVEKVDPISVARSSREYLRSYVQHRILPRYVVIPVFLIVFAGVLYIVGKFFVAGVGRMIWRGTERLILRVPLVSNVYSSVKQISDFALSHQTSRFSRVVIVEYPRTDVWSIGFVTNDGLDAIASVAGEPTISVFIPTSPMPASGFTVSVRKSRVVDTSITLEQAIQYIVSCGVVVPNPAKRKQP